MAASGAKVLQLRSVEYARTHGVRIHCRSSFEDGPGTVVLGEDETMEHPLITAVTHSTEEARITLLGVPDRPGAAAAIFGALADAELQRRHDHPERAARARAATPRSRSRSPPRICAPPSWRSSRCRPSSGSRDIDTDPEIGKVSIVGAGMRSHPGVAAKVFETLAGEDINIEMISTSPIKISCVIRSDRCPRRCAALHTAFELGAGEVQRGAAVGQEAR